MKNAQEKRKEIQIKRGNTIVSGSVYMIQCKMKKMIDWILNHQEDEIIINIAKRMIAELSNIIIRSNEIDESYRTYAVLYYFYEKVLPIYIFIHDQQLSNLLKSNPTLKNYDMDEDGNIIGVTLEGEYDLVIAPLKKYPNESYLNDREIFQYATISKRYSTLHEIFRQSFDNIRGIIKNDKVAQIFKNLCGDSEFIRIYDYSISESITEGI